MTVGRGRVKEGQLELKETTAGMVLCSSQKRDCQYVLRSNKDKQTYTQNVNACITSASGRSVHVRQRWLRGDKALDDGVADGVPHCDGAVAAVVQPLQEPLDAALVAHVRAVRVVVEHKVRGTLRTMGYPTQENLLPTQYNTVEVP